MSQKSKYNDKSFLILPTFVQIIQECQPKEARHPDWELQFISTLEMMNAATQDQFIPSLF